MDQRLRYEELIAGKLQQLPVPDMQDQIWERIKFQLDLDMPEDDGPGTDTPGPSSPGIMGWGLAIVLIAFISIFIILKNKPVDTESQNINTISQPSISPVEPSGSPPDINNTNLNTRINANAQGEFIQSGNADSLVQNNVLVSTPALIDTAGVKTSQDLAQIIPPADTTTVPAKRPRGVQGISANDYRIVPKKDSVNKQ